MEELINVEKLCNKVMLIGAYCGYKCCLKKICVFIDRLVSSVFKKLGGLGSNPGSLKSAPVLPTVCHCCDVSSELCGPGAEPRRWVPPLVTRST